MILTAKEASLLKDLKSQEELCVEKYAKYAAEACDPQLKNLFMQIGQTEMHHLQSINQLSSGVVPQMNSSNGQQQQQQQQQQPSTPSSSCNAEQQQRDAYLCKDALSMEKHVSAEYNTCIFEFTQPEVHNILNHIQTEEQQHGEKLYNYMSQHGIYS